MIYYLWSKLQDHLDRTWLGSVLQLLDQVTFRALGATILAFVLVLVAGKPVIAWLRRMKIGDSGLADTALLASTAGSRKNVPTMGGVLIVGALCASTALLADINYYVVMGLLTVLWLAGVGAVDDWLKLKAASRPGASRQGLFAWEKLVFQLVIGALIGYFTYQRANPDVANNLAHVLNLPFQKTYLSATGGVSEGLIYLSRGVFVVLATMMIAGMSNAVNITDGMDGLASGITAAVTLGLMILCLIAGIQGWSQYLLVPHVPESAELAVMAGATLGACLGFLWFNCAPAAVFMGDTGALALGGLLGYIALVVRQEVLLLFMSAVFLIELGSVALQVGYFKATKGKRIFKVAPYHHHLHLCGWTEQQVVVRFWIISMLLVVVALASVKVR